jgi:hypothetical protein
MIPHGQCCTGPDRYPSAEPIPIAQLIRIWPTDDDHRCAAGLPGPVPAVYGGQTVNPRASRAGRGAVTGPSEGLMRPFSAPGASLKLLTGRARGSSTALPVAAKWAGLRPATPCDARGEAPTAPVPIAKIQVAAVTHRVYAMTLGRLPRPRSGDGLAGTGCREERQVGRLG